MESNPLPKEPNEFAPSQRHGSRSLVQILWERKSLIALSVVVAMVLATLYYVQATPVYQATAQVLVVKKRPDSITGMDTRHLSIEDYVSTHQTLITSRLIVGQAIKKRKLDALPCFDQVKQDPKQDLTEAIKKSLAVSRNKATGANTNNVLNLSFRCTDPDACRTVVNAVIESYKDFLDVTYHTSSKDTLDLFVKARDLLQKDIKEQEAAYRNFLKETPVYLGRGKDGALLPQERMSNIELKRSALAVRKAEVKGYLEALEEGLKKGGSREALLALVGEWNGTGDAERPRRKRSSGFQDQLYELLMEEKKLLESKGEKHPEVQVIRDRIKLTRSFLASPLGPLQEPSAPEKGSPRAADPIDQYRQYFKQQVSYLATAEKLLNNVLKEEQDSARALLSYEREDQAFRTDIARKEKLYDTLVKRLQDVDLIKDVGGYDASTISPPRLGKKVQPSALLVFPVALFLGCLLGVGTAYLAEVKDKSFRSVEDVRRRLGLQVMGQIPVLRPADETLQRAMANGAVLDPMLCSYYRSKSAEAEAYRGVRTALYFSTRGQGHKIIQITSPAGGDGKTTLAANLAASIAQSGKKVLLINADLRKPRIHKVFGMTAKVGLASIIAGEAEPAEAIQESSIPGLAILPCGPLPPNPAELLTSPRFKELLDVMRDAYDFVIVDTPPLLVVTDPSVVAHRVDGVLLTIRFTKNGRPEATRAKDILETLGANVLGVVVNDTSSKEGGKYGYGYGYGYTADYHDGEGQASTPAKNGSIEMAARSLAHLQAPPKDRPSGE